MIPQAFPGTLWLIAKLFTLLGVAVYIVFAGVMVRQEHLMANVLEEGSEAILRILTYIHLALAIGIFILALIIL